MQMSLLFFSSDQLRCMIFFKLVLMKI